MLDRIARTISRRSTPSATTERALTRRGLVTRTLQTTAAALVAGGAASTITLRANAQAPKPDQASGQETSQYIERYGAIAASVRSYTRVIPPDIRRPPMDWIVANIARFESTDAALSMLPDIQAEGIASIRERWPTLELVETALPTSVDPATRRLFDGTIGSTYFTTFHLFHVNDLVGTVGGYSRWSPLVFEIAYLGDLVTSLAAGDEGGDLASLLPSNDLLVGGLQVRETE